MGFPIIGVPFKGVYGDYKGVTIKHQVLQAECAWTPEWIFRFRAHCSKAFPPK